MTTVEHQPLERRPCLSLGVEVHGGWQLKFYGIVLPGESLPGEVLAAARRRLRELGPAPTAEATGFVIVHQGRESTWLLVNLWHNDILHQTTDWAARGEALEFTPVPSGGPSACVWELPVIAHERDAYVTHVLEPRTPRLQAYLASQAAENAPWS